ncbi:phosphatidylserine decarboxylase [Sulfurimonas sp.]|nr:phosphatidylserine decarboxylase [Sulfurimonas sp.]
MSNNLFPIARYGLSCILGSTFAFIIFTILDFEFLQFISFFTTLFFIYVFRNPERENRVFEESAVISPVDGIVTNVEEINDGNYSYKIEIQGSYLNVSLLRVPLTSTVLDVAIKRGSRLSSFSHLSEALNETAEVVFQDNNSNKVKVVHTLKKSFKSIELDIKAEQKLYSGSRYGLMVNGITTMYLPENFRFDVSVGTNLVSCEDLIGYFSN